MVVVVFIFHSLLWHHDAQQNAFVLFEETPPSNVFKSEVVDDVEVDRNIVSRKDVPHALFVKMVSYL